MVYSLRRVQKLPIDLEQAWSFFSSPLNLREITPEYMQFVVHTDPESLQMMYPGQAITYTVRPVLGIPLFWMTEITHVDYHRFFVDDQRSGPYKIWHHQHHFRSIPGGVEMLDWVHYELPMGWLGRLAHFLFVKKQLEGIFDYRREKLLQMFGKFPE